MKNKNNSLQTVLRIATRKSPLALWQANYVKEQLEETHPELKVEILGMLTEGDKILTLPLAEIGGKGLFVKELEQAILERRADMAVHSIKDMPAVLTNRLILGAVCNREDPRDVFVSNGFPTLESLPPAAVVGTSSSRRISLLKSYASNLQIETLRGNVGTRLQRLDEGKFAGIILAAAGLKRLGEQGRISQYLDPQEWIPAIGQGAIGIECREDDSRTLDYLAPLEDMVARQCVNAERAMNRALGGSCQLPIAAYATIEQESLLLCGLVGDPRQPLIIKGEVRGSKDEAEQLGEALAEQLLSLGADKILAAYR